jgi:hypothetical protein
MSIDLSNLIDNCSVETDKYKNVLIDKIGGKSKYIIENKTNKKYSQIDIENCVYKNLQNETKCDFGIKTENIFYLVELKGSDVKKGIEQLLSTLIAFKNYNQSLDFKARLIVTRFQSPNLVKKNAVYKNLVKLLKHIENKNNHLIIKQNIYTEII